MKIKLLMTGLLGLITAASFAQKGELNNAQSEYEKYESLRQTKAMANMAGTSLTNAKTSIDKAAANEKTANLPQTYALKGAIYSALVLADSTSAASSFTTAESSLKKAKELDTKGDYKKIIDNANLNLAQYQLNNGVKAYQSGKYDAAYTAFDFYRQVLPEDTNAIYYTGLAAANAKNYNAALTNYNKLVTTNYSKKPQVYLDMSSIYLANKDTAGAIKAATEGASKFPNNAELAKRQIELNLQTGKQEQVLSQIQSAISKDPKNKTLYYYAGLTYSQAAEATDKKIAAAKDAATKTQLQQTKAQDFSKAAEMYKKALEIDPNYFEANLNCGYVLIAPAIDMYNAANKLPTSKQKEYAAAMAKANAQFDSAKPYLQKAVDLDPKSVDALRNLQTYYRAKRDNANVTKLQAQIDAANK